MANWWDSLGTFSSTFKVGGKDGPTLEQVAATARLRLSDLLRWLPGGIAEPGELASDSSGDLRVIRNNLSASVAPTADDDDLDGYEVGSRWIDTTADKAYVCVDATATAAIWRVSGESTQSLGNRSGIDITFYASSTDYVEKTSSTYEVFATFLFPGTASFTPTSFKAVTSSNSATNSDVRIYDVTNALEITVLNFTASAKTIGTGSALSNLPAGQAIFEIQMRSNSGGKARLHFAQLR